MPQFVFRHAKLHYLDHGPDQGLAPSVLFLHAFPLNADMWKPQAELKSHHRLLALDLPGFGKSACVEGSPHTIELFAEAALALLDSRAIEKAVVVGLSLGGYVAFELNRIAPQRLAGLVLCDTRASADTEDGKKARETTARAVEEDGPEILVERMLPNLLSGAASPGLRKAVEQLIVANSAVGVAAALRAMGRRIDYTPTLPSIACPTLVMNGQHDVLSPPADGSLLSRAIPNARYETVEGAGHLSNVESPDAFNRLLSQFLRAL